MEAKNHRKTIWLIIIIVAAVAWCFTIFNLSGATSSSSNSTSTSLSKKVITKVLDATNEAGITDSHPDEVKLAKAADLLNKPLRKAAHATVYFVLALILLAVGRVIFSSKKYLLTCFLTLLFCFVFAMTDEYHQTFVDGRTGQFSDVLIDTAGACVGVLLFSSYYLVWWIGNKSGNKDESHDKQIEGTYTKEH